MSNASFLTTAEVASVLGVSPRQVSRLVPNVLEPAAKAPGPRGAYLFDRADVVRERDRRIEAARKAVEALDAHNNESPVASLSDGPQAGEAPPTASPATHDGVSEA